MAGFPHPRPREPSETSAWLDSLVVAQGLCRGYGWQARAQCRAACMGDGGGGGGGGEEEDEEGGLEVEERRCCWWWLLRLVKTAKRAHMTIHRRCC